MNSPGRYRYEPLQSREVRLLHLKPGERQNSIQLSLVNVRLQGDFVYEALSYTWGDSDIRIPIACNEAGDVLEVTRNCEAGLRMLRRKDKERILWIDAICIDQGNVGERSSQIQFMPDIYSRAARVIAFLGEASEDSDLGMDFILDDSESVHRDNRPSIGPLQQRAINRILERAYFERVWIRQEILMARDIQIVLGEKAADWRAFSNSVYYIDANNKLHLGGAYRNLIPAVVFWRDRSTIEKPRTLLQFLHKTRYCKSSDPRDNVYALLAMTPEKIKESMVPGYRQSPGDIFLSVARFLIVHHKNLDVLCHCQSTPSGYGLPSWTPDWNFHRVSRALGLPNISLRPYKADGGRPASIGFGESPETLILKGKTIDTVRQVGTIYHEGINPSASLREWETIALSAVRDPTSQKGRTTFLETMIAYPAYSGPNAFERFHSAWRSMMLDQEVLERKDAAGATIFQNLVNEKCHGRRIFVTEKGYIGIGPAEMQPKHLVAALLGGQVPFVLSKIEANQYSLVGECYVHGFMSGEAVRGNEDEMDLFYLR